MNKNYLKCLAFIRSAQVRFFRIPKPFIASWHITRKCNFRCPYCTYGEKGPNELSTSRALSLVDDITNCGVKLLAISGGEPLLREDIGKIIEYSLKKQLHVGLATNGFLFPDRFNEIKNINFVKLSLDGKKEVHDSIRGIGAFQNAIRTIECCLKQDIPIRINCVISSRNYNKLNDIIELANHYKIKVTFQPVSSIHSEDKNIDSILPTVHQLQEAQSYLKDQIIKNKNIVNSSESISSFLNTSSQLVDFFCYAGLFLIVIEHNGKLGKCVPFMKEKGIDIFKNGGVRASINKLDLRNSCYDCTCVHTLEMNLLLNLKTNPFKRLKRLY